MNTTLYFFTSSFPFSFNEPFIENEILFLSEEFDKITIIPLLGEPIQKISVPKNCNVLQPIIKSKKQQYLKGFLGYKAFKFYFEDLIKNKAFFSFNKIKRNFISYCQTNNLLHSGQIKNVLTQIKENDIMYFYWGKGSANLLPFITNIHAKKIVRFHGGDLYDYRYNGYLPIQKQIISGADVCSFISKNGEDYLHNRYPEITFKSVVNYLGTRDFGVSSKSTDDKYRLLSCSYLVPLKRVFLIYEALQNITDISIEWTHIGDGPDYNELKVKAKNSRKNIKINLAGQLSNSAVMDYYKNNPVDGFINVSKYEGLPVSLMEAISFNVPVIGTNVGGTSEIVNKETGILLNQNPSVDEIANAIKNLRSLKIEPKKYWKEHFWADKNYTDFIQSTLLNKKLK